MADMYLVCSHCLRNTKVLYNSHTNFPIELYRRRCDDCLILHRVGEGRDNRYWQHGWIT